MTCGYLSPNMALKITSLLILYDKKEQSGQNILKIIQLVYEYAIKKSISLTPATFSVEGTAILSFI